MFLSLQGKCQKMSVEEKCTVISFYVNTNMQKLEGKNVPIRCYPTGANHDEVTQDGGIIKMLLQTALIGLFVSI